MNEWAQGFFGRPIIDDWSKQLDFTTKIFRARGLHLDDRHVRHAGGDGLLRVDRRCGALRRQQPPPPARRRAPRWSLYLPKIQTAEEARPVERHPVGARAAPGPCPMGTIKVYVLVEQVEACFQLMEIRAALGKHFVGFNTGRWDYINSVSDAMAWDRDFVNPNIDAITMTYGYMRNYEDRVRRAVQHARQAGPVRALAGRHGAQHPGRLRSRRRQRHEASGGRRRARAARGRQRQVGRPLEDGSHRAAGLGKGRTGQPAGAQIPAAHLHRGRRRRPLPARAGAAHRARRARSAERRAAVRQRLPGRASRRPRSSRPTISATTTSST